MNFDIMLFYILAVFVLIVTPGPVVALVLRNSSLGFKNGFFTIVGTNLASLVLILVASAVILGLFEISAKLLNLLSIFGSVFIFYLGFSSFLKEIKSKNKDENSNLLATKSPKKCFVQGLGIALSNPKDIIFFMTFFPQFIGITNSIYLSLVSLVLIWILLDFSLLLAYAFLMKSSYINKFKRLISILSDLVLMSVGIFGFVYLLV